MKQKMMMMMAALAVLALELRTGGKVEMLANDGTHPTGNVTRYAEAALATRNLLVIKGTAENEVLVGTAAAEPLGVCTDEPLIDQPCNIALLGVADGTMTMVASKAIDVGERVYATAGGKVTDAVVAGAFLVGRALTAGTTDAELEVAHCFPVVNPA